jgi:signal transduction histidine kinase
VRSLVKRELMKRPGNSRRALVWQTAIIVLPVIILASVGAFYLQQDRILVRHEAEERARLLAQEIRDDFWQALTSPAAISNELAFRLGSGGTLLFPAPYEKAPSPRPLNLDVLTPDQRQIWNNPQPDSLTYLPADFQGVASYGLALRLVAENRVTEAADAFRTIYRQSPRRFGETGLPLDVLAGVKAMEFPELPPDKTGGRPLNWEILCQLALIEPSALTPIILERAGRAGVLPAGHIREFQEEWQRHETLRELYRASRAQLNSTFSDSPGLFWIRNAGERWLAARVDENPTNHWIVCRRIPPPQNAAALPPVGPPASTARQIGLNFRQGQNDVSDIRTVQALMGPDLKLIPGLGTSQRPAATTPARLIQSLQSLPDYLGITAIAADEPVVALTNTPVLATATHVENGRELLKVSLHLTHPQLLYARQKQRVVWFGLLISISTLAAITGLIAAWRSFDKQQRLTALKDNFVSSVSHELRAPIASVRLMAEGLERGRVQEPEKQREYFRFILQECRRLSALIQNVLDFSRIDQGRQEYEFEPADVLRLVDETVKGMEPMASERHIQLSFTPPASPVNATIDARAIQQALVNLLDNAIKHSSPGSKITVGLNVLKDIADRRSRCPSASPRSIGGRTLSRSLLQIFVQDQGEGIPATEHERIFERFYRVGSELRRQTPGAGIGLSIVKHIVDAHEGRVTVESEPRQGSRFTITIPLKDIGC